MFGSAINKKEDRAQNDRIRKLQEKLKGLCDGEAEFCMPPGMPVDMQESELEDILAFESVGNGISMFEGLQSDGMDLPRPEELDELQSERKVMEVLHALAEMRIFFIGFEGMSGRKFYRELFNRMLWEGCYVKKRNPGAITLIDVSHKMQRSEIQQFLDRLMAGALVH